MTANDDAKVIKITDITAIPGWYHTKINKSTH